MAGSIQGGIVQTYTRSMLMILHEILASTLRCANIRKDWFNGSMLMDTMKTWLSLFNAQTCEMNAPCSNAHDLIRSISFYIALCANLR